MLTLCDKLFNTSTLQLPLCAAHCQPPPLGSSPHGPNSTCLAHPYRFIMRLGYTNA